MPLRITSLLSWSLNLIPSAIFEAIFLPSKLALVMVINIASMMNLSAADVLISLFLAISLMYATPLAA